MTEKEKLTREIYTKIEELENRYHIPSSICYCMDYGFSLKGTIEDIEEFVKILVKNKEFDGFIKKMDEIGMLVKKKLGIKG